jgi:alkylated DNA nucleotide flippase Atl1
VPYLDRVDDFLVDRVLLAVEQIPSGRVVSYGDIARLVGCGPRRVGTIMRLYAHDVPYWRVVGAAGDPGGNVLVHFRPHWRAEGIAVKPNGFGCRIADYRTDLRLWEADYRTALALLLARAGTPLPAIGGPATAALKAVGVSKLEHLVEFTEAELLALPGVGPKAVRILAAELAAQGWRFRAAPAGV